MKSFPEKVKDARIELGFTQHELADKIGVSLRTITAYEKGEKLPRTSTMFRLAKTLKVSVRFLSDDSCSDPMADIEKDGYIEEARSRYGGKGGRDINALLSENAALFAGGELSEDEKDLFYEAVTRAYFACKEEARRKFGRKTS